MEVFLKNANLYLSIILVSVSFHDDGKVFVLSREGHEHAPTMKNRQDIDDRPIWAGHHSKTKTELGAKIDDKLATTKVSEENIKAEYWEELKKQFKEQKKNSNAELLDVIFRTKSQKKCFEYCITNKHVHFIHGGENALLHEFPSMAALGFGPEKSVVWNNCAGTLISDEFVLTAAHCVTSEAGAPSLVRLGEHDFSRDNETHLKPRDYKVIQVIVHPNYVSGGSQYNDIAMLKLETRIVETPHVRPACLSNTAIPMAPQGKPAKNASIAGWGTLGFGYGTSDILQKASVDIIDNEQCRKLMGTDNFFPDGISDSQLCAGVLAGGRDACTGDSGGPLQIKSTWADSFQACPLELVGVTSIGRDCGIPNSPGIYTRVSSFIPWIESIAWPGDIDINTRVNKSEAEKALSHHYYHF